MHVVDRTAIMPMRNIKDAKVHLAVQSLHLADSWAGDSYPDLKSIFFLPELKHVRVENTRRDRRRK